MRLVLGALYDTEGKALLHCTFGGGFGAVGFAGALPFALHPVHPLAVDTPTRAGLTAGFSFSLRHVNPLYVCVARIR